MKVFASVSLLLVVLMSMLVGCSEQEPFDNMWTQNIYPAINNTYTVGDTTHQYADGYFVNLSVSGDMNFSNITTAGNITASYFIGDGSQLTGLEQGELILYFLNDSSPDMVGMDRLSSDYDSSEVTLSQAGLGDGSTLMGTWITDAGVPSKNLLTGNLRVHVTGKKTGGTKNAQFYYEIYKCNASGVEIELLGTSEYTDILTAARIDYRIWVLLPETNLNTSDRIKVEGYTFVSGGGSAPSVEAYIQGASNTRLVVPVGAISVEKFMPYIGAIKDLVTTYDVRCEDLVANDDIWCDVAYTRTVGIESSLYHIGDPDTFLHFNDDEIYFEVDGFKAVQFLNASSTFYNNVSMEQCLTVDDDLDVGGNMTIRSDGTIAPASMANASALNNSIFYSTDNNKLCYKDSTGTVHELY